MPRGKYQRKRAGNTAPAVATGPTGVIAGGKLSNALTKVIEGIRVPFTAVVDGFAAFRVKAEELAPRFMAAFSDWQKETGRERFVEFCRVVDPRIPMQRDSNESGEGYRSSHAYQAADNLRRIYNASAEGREQRGGNGRNAPMRTATWRMARFAASLLPLLKKEAIAQFWAAVATELELSPTQVNTLRNVTETTKPLIEVVARPQALKIVHAEPIRVTEAQPGVVQPDQRTGTHG